MSIERILDSGFTPHRDGQLNLELARLGPSNLLVCKLEKLESDYIEIQHRMAAERTQAVEMAQSILALRRQIREGVS